MLRDGSRQETGEDALRFVAVRKSFGTVMALRDVDFGLARGRIVGLIGDNGAGKTTLIRLATGILTPTAGHVFTLGRPATREDRWLMGRLGALIENPGQYDELTVEQNLQFVYSFYDGTEGSKPDGDAVRDALTEFGAFPCV